MVHRGQGVSHGGQGCPMATIATAKRAIFDTDQGPESHTFLLKSRLDIDMAKNRHILISFDMGPKRGRHMATRTDTWSWSTIHVRGTKKFPYSTFCVCMKQLQPAFLTINKTKTKLSGKHFEWNDDDDDDDFFMSLNSKPTRDLLSL